MRAGVAIAAGGIAVALAMVSGASAKSFVVSERGDHRPGKCTKRDCTLREAVLAANARTGADVIRLPREKKPYDLRRPGTGEDQARNGDLDLADDQLVIRGAGVRRSVIRQRRSDRVLDIPGTDAATVSLRGLTVEGGRTDTNGGGIRTNGLLFLSAVAVTGNRAAGSGGGIAVNFRDDSPIVTTGQLTMSRSRVTGNRAERGGGGIDVKQAVFETTIAQSQISGNTASVGGGFAYARDTVVDSAATIVNTTLSGNHARDLASVNPYSTGGGIAAYGDVRFVFSTVARNSAPPSEPGEPRGANVYVNPGDVVQPEDSIIADALGGPPNCHTDGVLDSEGHNLATDASCALDQGSDEPGVPAGLRNLGANGGPTATHALKPGSNAVGAALCNPLLLLPPVTVDQRGFGRPTANCDIGAFERGGTAP